MPITETWQLKEWVLGIWLAITTALVGLVRYFMKREIKRIDGLEGEMKKKLDTVTHNASMDSLRKEIREGNESTSRLIIEQSRIHHERIDRLSIELAKNGAR